jgi:hypothetical protein
MLTDSDYPVRSFTLFGAPRSKPLIVLTLDGPAGFCRACLSGASRDRYAHMPIACRTCLTHLMVARTITRLVASVSA